MPFEFDPTEDFSTVVDRTEDVVLTRVETLATIALTGALRVELTQQEADASSGKYTRDDARWSLVAEQLPEPPQLGDTLTDSDADVWTILEVKFVPSASRYDCITRRVAITAGLDQQIDIQLATWTAGDSGAPIATWNTVETNVPARIQPLARNMLFEHHRRLRRTLYKVFVAQVLDWTENHRIIGPAGKVYDVIRLEKSARIDLLDEVTVCESPWPFSP